MRLAGKAEKRRRQGSLPMEKAQGRLTGKKEER